MVRKKWKRTFGFKDEEIDLFFASIVSFCGVSKTWFRDYVLAFLLYMTGLRLSEALTLQLPDIDFAKKQIRIRAENNKCAEEQYIFMHDDVIFLLGFYIDRFGHLFKEGFIFYSLSKMKGEPHMHRVTYGRMVREVYLVRSGLDSLHFHDKQGHKRRRLRVHSLRKTFCTKIIMANPKLPLSAIAKVSRHKTLDVLQNHYFDINEPLVQEEAINNAF